MEFKNFEESVLRTANTKLTQKEQLMNCALGCGGETGEFLDILKKHYFHGHELDKNKALKELGDIMFYVTWSAVCLGSSLEKVCQMNVDKLKARYPEGFSSQASLNRPKE